MFWVFFIKGKRHPETSISDSFLRSHHRNMILGMVDKCLVSSTFMNKSEIIFWRDLDTVCVSSEGLFLEQLVDKAFQDGFFAFFK